MSSNKKVSINLFKNTIANAQPYRHEKQTKQERMQSARELRKNGMGEGAASPRTIHNTWANDNGSYGGRKTRRKKMKNNRKSRTKKNK
jgi:hypothetical protein